MVPQSQTSSSVQFDQVLTSLQAPVRQDLQVFLKEFGGALDKYGGAKGFQESFRTSPAAYEYTSQVNQALLGTQPGDLAGFVSNLDVVARELNANSTDLQGLITNLNTVSGDFAAHQASLRDAIVELPQALAVGRPALFKLNQDFPALRAFAREALPGREVRQPGARLREPVDRPAPPADLQERAARPGRRPAAHGPGPGSAQQRLAAVPRAGEGALASCFNNVVIPWSNTRSPTTTAIRPAAKVYQETAYGFTGVAGESRSGDANGQEFRVLGGGGSNTIAPFSTPDLAGTADRRRARSASSARSRRSSRPRRPRSVPTCRVRPRIRPISTARSARRRHSKASGKSATSASPRRTPSPRGTRTS